MKAILVERTGGVDVLQIASMAVPEPGPGQVRVRIAAAGVCSHDVAMRRGILKRNISMPFVPGHEVAGTVDALGAGVSRFRVGDRVASTQRQHVCGICDDCRSARETYCDKQVFLGHGLDCGGGYAEFTVIGEENLCAIPEGVGFAAASIAGCAIGSSLNAVRDVGRVRAGETVLVTGAGGGLGIHALQVARASGAQVIAVSSDPRKRELLMDAGADTVVEYARGTDFSEGVRAATRGRGADVLIDNVGTPIFQACRRSLAKEGRWVLVGELAGEFIPFNPAQLIHRGISMLSVHSATRVHLRDCLALLAGGRIRAFVDRELPLAQAAQAHALVEAGHVTGRVVLVP